MTEKNNIGYDKTAESFIIDKINAIIFRAERALYTEISLAYDEASLCDSREERVPHLTRAQTATSVLRAIVSTANNVCMKLMNKEIPPVLPALFADIMEAEKCDDDEEIAEFLLNLEDYATKRVKKILREYVEQKFEGDGDEC